MPRKDSSPEDHFELPPDTGDHAVAGERKPGGVRRLSLALRRVIALAVIGFAIFAVLAYGPKRIAIPVELHAGQSAPIEVRAGDSTTRADGLGDGERSILYFLTTDPGPFEFAIPLPVNGAAFAKCGHVVGETGGVRFYSPFRGYTPMVIGSTKGDKPAFTLESVEPDGTRVACLPRAIKQ